MDWLPVNKYSLWYKNIILNAKWRADTKAAAKLILGYVEAHHIHPKCLGGSNAKENFAFLTGREHFVCHQLLSKIFPDNVKLAMPLFFFNNDLVKNTRKFEHARKKYAELLKGLPKTDEHRQAISNALRGKKFSDERKNNISKSKTGKSLSDSHRRHLSTALSLAYKENRKQKHFLGENHSIETKQKISVGLKEFYTENEHYDLTIEQKKKISETLKAGYASGKITHGMKNKKQTEESKEKNRQKALARPKVICPHCNKSGPKPNMIQHHFNNCKFNVQKAPL